MKKAIFLDRDGTLNEDPGYINSPDIMKLYPGVGEALSLLKKNNYILVLITNQSGVGRGFIKREDLPKIHERMNELLAPSGGEVEFIFVCTHHPDLKCGCRKPNPAMLLKASAELSIDLSRSFMIGDRNSDILAGKNAGCRASILVRTGDGVESEKRLKPGDADFVANNLTDAAQWILSHQS